MKKAIIIFTSLCIGTLSIWAQGVIDALPELSSQLQGTARYTSMAGAFGALGGDMTTIRQNPAGIGVFRNSEVSVTAGLNFYNNTVTNASATNKNDGFYFTGDNLGVVGSIKLRNSTFRNINFGFAYNNIANFNNVYRADWRNIRSSLTQMIAANTTQLGVVPDDLALYNDIYRSNLPWMSILAYNTYLINPTGANSSTYTSIFQNNTTGNAYLQTATSGAIDEYDFNVSGNVLDKLYWGLSVNVTSIAYHLDSYYGETLRDAEVAALLDGGTTTTNGSFDLHNLLSTRGMGAGVKLGLIYRPISFLRLGFAFHSPTYYDLTDTYSAAVGYDFANVGGERLHGSMDDIDNMTDLGSFSYHLTTPWHIMASVATVIGKLAIVSFDYEYIDATDMQYSSIDANYEWSNNAIATQMQAVHNVRVGAEFRATPSLSIRAGYAYESSPMRQEYFDGTVAPLLVEGTLAQYQIPGDTHNISCGLGYRISNFNIDLAYVHRMQDYSIYPFETADAGYRPTTMDLRHNTLKITFGYRF